MKTSIYLIFILITTFSYLYGADPFAAINTQVNTLGGTIRQIALGIAAIGLIGVVVIGLLNGNMDKGRLVMYAIGIIIIAGATAIVGYLADWVK